MPNSGNTEVFYKHLLLLGLSTVNPPLHCQTSLTCLPGVRPLHPRLGRLGGLSAAGSAFAGRLGHLARGCGARRRGLALTLALDQSEVSISCQCPPIRGEYQLSVSTNHSSPSCPWRAAAASPARPPCGPIRSEYCGHVTSSPPMTAHLAARCSASILSFSSLRSSASFSATALALDTR